MVKIIATSDWHIGNLFHGNDRMPEHKHFFNWLLAQINERQPDALLIAGDVFDTSNPSAGAQALYYEFLADATSSCPDMKIIISGGNHDSAFRLEAPRALLTRHNIEVRGKVKRNWKQSENGENWEIDYDDLMIPIEGKEGGRLVVLVVPYLRNDIVGGGSYSEGVNKFLRDITEKAREKYPDTPLVMMAHMYAKGSEIAQNERSEKIEIGGMEEVNMDGWENHPDYFTSGHIHKRQHIWNTNWARYTGSILPMSFAEKDYNHGLDLVTIYSEKKPQVEFLEYKPQHKLRVIPEDEEELTPAMLKKKINKELEDRGEDGELKENFEYLSIKVKLENVNNDEIKALEKIIEKKNAVLCKIQKIKISQEETPVIGNQQIRGIDDIVSLNPLKMLKETYKIKYEEEMNPHQEEMLSSIINSLNEEA